MSFEAGSIFYTIKADTGALLIADKEVSSFNRSAQEGVRKNRCFNEQTDLHS